LYVHHVTPNLKTMKNTNHIFEKHANQPSLRMQAKIVKKETNYE
jgi:hypothetical protein